LLQEKLQNKLTRLRLTFGAIWYWFLPRDALQSQLWVSRLGRLVARFTKSCLAVFWLLTLVINQC